MKLPADLTLLVVIVAAFLLVGCGSTSFIADDDGPTAIDVGNKAFSAEMFDTALNAYSIAKESMPDRQEPTYNTANTLYRQERFREAIEMYDEILRGQEPELSNRSTFNVANALYEAGDHEQAIEMYKQALRINPDDFDAKHNLELALAHLPQPPQPAQDSQEGQPAEEPQPSQPPGQPGDGPPQEGEGDEPIEGEGDEPQQGEGDEPIEGEGDEPQQGEGDEPIEGEADEQGIPGSDSTEWPIIPPSGLTEAQARRLLEMVGESAEPLRNAIQRESPGPGSQSQLAQEW